MAKIKRQHRLVGKGIQFPFLIAAVAWIDLLGYGSMISGANFNPLHPEAQRALQRLRQFHRIIAEHSNRYFRTLVMNDGAAVYRDLSMSARSVTHDFLVKSWRLFRAINSDESDQGLPGARMVLSCGFRMRGRRGGIDPSNRQFQSVVERYKNNGVIEGEQAIREAAAIRQPFDAVPQLQANFAFTKAYVAESGGSKVGLEGPRLYVDLALFGRPLPEWISFGPEIAWKHEQLRLSGTFAAVNDILESTYPEGGPTEILSALQIAQNLAGDIDVLKGLRSARKMDSGVGVEND